MLLVTSAVIVCCTIIVNAESTVNSHSFADSNGYDYSNTATNNGYLGSKDSYQNGGSFYAGGITGNHELSNHVGHSLINPDTQGNIGDDSYNGYSSSSNHESEYTGYSNTYENSNGDSYTLSTRATPASSFRGYSSNSNRDSAFKAYPSDSIYKDSEFGNQYAASSSGNSNKRIPYSSGYVRPTVFESYSKGSDSGIQGYRGTSDVSSYSENDHVYSTYSPDNLAGEHSFAKQKDGPYSLKNGGKYSDTVYSMPSETRYTRGNVGNVGPMGYGRDVPSYALNPRPSSYFPKTAGVYISSGKPSKYYGYNKYPARHAPNSGTTHYLSRDRDSYYAPYVKGSGKVIIIKDNRPSYGGGHVYSDEQPYSGSYRDKSGGNMNGYSASPTFDSYSVGGNSYDDSPTLTRRYRNSGGPVLVQKKIYPW